MADDNMMELSSEEAAFFDSKGETAPAETVDAEPVKEVPAAKVEAPVKDEPAVEAETEEEPTAQRGDLSKAVVAKNREISELKRQKRELETNQATLNGRMSVLERLARGLPATEEAVQPPVVDPDNDPLSAIKMTYQKVQELEGQLAQRQQQEHMDTQQKVFVDNYQAAARKFTESTPDFPQAYQHLIQGREAELAVLGHTPDRIAQIVAGEERFIINSAFENGRDPIETIYNLSKQRGYAKAAPEPAPAANDANKIAAMVKAEKATKTLSNAAGAASSTPTLDALANMSEDDFAEATKGNNWRKLVGG